MAKKKFYLETRATFKGIFIIEANSKEEAREIFNEDCSMGMLREPYTDNESVVDFSVSMHPESESILSVTLKTKK